MASLRARLVIFLLRHRHWLRLRWKRETIDWNTSIPELRSRIEKTARIFGKPGPDIEVSPVAIGGLSAEWLRPSGAHGMRAILYFHGGGYVMGSSRSHRGVVAKFVRGSGMPALVFDYRLAPEHTFPAALDDAVAAYLWLLAQGFPAGGIVFAGDSAGGGLCLATLLAVRNMGLPMAAAAVAISPWTDLACTGNSYRCRDPLAPGGSWQVFSTYYTGDNDPCLPLISPLYGDLAGLPPLLVHVGEEEAMLDDSIRFAEKARHAGVTVDLQIGKGMVHCYPVLAPLFLEATDAMAHICTFLRAHVAEV